MNKNFDEKTIRDFGKEWTCFDQSILEKSEAQAIFNQYFSIFPFEKLPLNAVGFDLGCGSGRWAKVIAPKIGKLYCIDASEDALNIAKKNLKLFSNIEFVNASVEAIPLSDNSMDFAYSLGVLHHIPDTQAGIQVCVKKLKLGAPLLLYLYYAFDNKPTWFKCIWKVTDIIRKFVARLPFFLKYSISQIIATVGYLPVARLALILEKCGLPVDNIPLSAYRKRSFYVMRTDALDRFGTRLEQRFTKAEIMHMMQTAGLENISFNNDSPFWCAVGYKKS